MERDLPDPRLPHSGRDSFMPDLSPNPTERLARGRWPTGEAPKVTPAWESRVKGSDEPAQEDASAGMGVKAGLAGLEASAAAVGAGGGQSATWRCINLT